MKIEKIILFLAAVGFVDGPCFGSGATSISIVNPSFEDPLLGYGASNDAIPGWNEVNGGASDRIGVYHPFTSTYPSGIPDGTNVAYLWAYGTSIWQKTDKTLEGNDVSYTLSAFLGRRISEGQPATALELRAGNDYASSVLLDSLSVSANSITDGTFTNFVLTWDTNVVGFASALAANQGKSVIVAFSFAAAGTEVDVDAVQLSYVPEPGTLGLVAAGGAFLLAWLRRLR